MDKRRVKTGDLLHRFAWLWLLGMWVGGSLSAHAHDLWLEPGTPLAARGEELILHLRRGDAFTGDEDRPLQKDHITRFDLFSDRSRRRDLLSAGQDDQLPAAKVRLESGAALAVMDRTARQITMPPEKFNRYLADEGLDEISAQRTRLNQNDQPGREIYSRYLKALVQERDLTAATPNTLYKRRVGQRLEILLETDPSRLKPDGVLAVKILFDGKPLPNVKVFAYRHSPGGSAPPALTTVTSLRGLAEFRADQPGMWLVRLVHMRSVADKRPDAPAQWESFWAAYSFSVRDTPPPPPVPVPKEG